MGLNKFAEMDSNYLRIRDVLVDCIKDIMNGNQCFILTT